MAANSNAFLDRLLNQLLEIYLVTATKQWQCDHVIKDCHKLFQSWPQKREETGSQEGKEQTKISIDNLSEGIAGDAKQAMMSKRELAVLEKADKALAQAQKMRHKQAKLLEKELSKEGCKQQLEEDEVENNKGICSATSTSHDPPKTSSRRPSSECPKSASIRRSPSADDRVIKEKTSSQGQKTSSAHWNLRTSPCEGQRQNKDKTRAKEAQSRNNRSCGTTSSDTRGNTALGRKGLPKESIGVISQSSLSRVLNSTSSAGKSKYTPAHASAPFKTNTTVRQPLRAGRTARTSAPVCRTRVPKKGPLKPPTEKHPEEEVSSQKRIDMSLSREDNAHSMASDDTHGLKENHQEPGIHPLMTGMTNLRLEQNEAIHDTIARKDCSPDGESTKNQTGHQQPVCEAEKQLTGGSFNLLTDGQSLAVPAKMRRAIASNNKLRQHLRTAAMTVHAKEDKSALGSFLEKLTLHYNSQEAETGELFKTVVQMTALYKHYYHMMQRYQKMDILGLRSWQDVLRAKRTLENICLAFADMEDNYNCILERFGSGLQKPTKSEIISTSGKHQSTLLWLPPDLSTECINIPMRMKYRKISEIEQYLGLVHQLQLLQLQNHVVDTCKDSILPLLTSMEPIQGWFPQLYRAAYGLLCSGGKHLPIIIRDDFSNDDFDDNSVCSHTVES